MLSKITNSAPFFGRALASLAFSTALVGVAPRASAQTAPPARRAPASLTHEWTFDEGVANVADDRVGGYGGIGGADVLWLTGESPALGAAHDRLVVTWPTVADDPATYIDFGNAAGAFGSGDFTVMHFFLTSQNGPGTLSDVIGNRTSFGHGNFFAVRMRGDGILSVELDQDGAGTNYVGFLADGKPVNDSKLHHLAYVRQGASLSLYIDGVLVNSGQTSSGAPTYINGADSFRIGRRAPFAFTSLAAFYDDLRVYDGALTAEEIQGIASGG